MTENKAYEELAAIPRDDRGSPLTLEGCIRTMILKSPDMFQYRDDALNLLYCTLGTGIDWSKDGRLVDHSPNNYLNLPPDSKDWAPYRRQTREETIGRMLDGVSDEARPLMEKVAEEIAAEYAIRDGKALEAVAFIDERCQDYRPGGQRSWYPLSWYACSMAAPGNAQEDFWNGAIETAGLIIGTPAPPGTLEAARHSANQHFASKMIRLLLAQRPGTP